LEKQAVHDFINNRVHFIIDDMSPDLSKKICKINVAQESKRKLVLFGSETDGKVDWDLIKKRRLNPFGGSGPGLSRDRLAMAVQTYEDVKSLASDVDVQKDAVFIAHVKQDVLRAGVKGPLEICRTELAKRTQLTSRKERLMVGVIEPDARETLARFRRCRKAFGAHVEDRLLAISETGLQTARNGPLRFLPGDSFFNKWSVPLVQINQMAQMEEAAYDKMFEAETQTDRLASDAGMDDGFDISVECEVKHVIPFPHEYHPLLTKEEINVFRAEVIFDLAVGSGLRLLAAIEMNLKAVGCCKTAAHKQWVFNNLVKWVKEKRLVCGYVAPLKPPELLEYENRNLKIKTGTGATGAGSSLDTPESVKPPTTSAVSTGGDSSTPGSTPGAPATALAGSTPAARNLLAAFGKVNL